MDCYAWCVVCRSFVLVPESVADQLDMTGATYTCGECNRQGAHAPYRQED